MKKKRAFLDVGVAVAVLSLILGVSYGIYVDYASHSHFTDRELDGHMRLRSAARDGFDSATITAR